MITSVKGLVYGDSGEEFTETFCPLFKVKDDALEYAIKLADKYAFGEDVPCVRRDVGEDIIVDGRTWTTVVSSVDIGKERYYEVAKIRMNCSEYMLPEYDYSIKGLMPVLNPFRDKLLTVAEMARLEEMTIDTNGYIYRRYKEYQQYRCYYEDDKGHFTLKVKLPVRGGTEHAVKDLMWAVFNSIHYDTVLMMTLHISQYCTGYISTMYRDKLDILELRNLGWQWAVANIDGDPSNNSWYNLEMVTLQTYKKLADFRQLSL